MKLTEELKRLNGEPVLIEKGQLVVNFIVKCDGDASDVLRRAKEVLIRIIDCELTFEDSVEDWKAVLPEWFVNIASPELTRQEAEKLLSTPQGYEILARSWTVSGFIHWFRPEMRSWYWYDGEVRDRNNLLIQVLTYGYPFASGALEWLFKACGAERFEEIEV